MDHSLEQLKQHTQGVKENILSRAECDFWMFTSDYSLELQANSLGEPHQTNMMDSRIQSGPAWVDKLRCRNNSDSSANLCRIPPVTRVRGAANTWSRFPAPTNKSRLSNFHFTASDLHT